MEIRVEPPEDVAARWRVTVDVEGDVDDPNGWVRRLADEHLAGALQLFGQGDDLPAGVDWRPLFADAGEVVARLESVMALLLWRARDTGGLSWGEIAEETGQGPKGIRGVVERTRMEMARAGAWRDERGLHHDDDPEVALAAALAREAELGARRSPRRDGEEVIETLRALGVEPRTDVDE